MKRSMHPPEKKPPLVARGCTSQVPLYKNLLEESSSCTSSSSAAFTLRTHCPQATRNQWPRTRSHYQCQVIPAWGSRSPLMDKLSAAQASPIQLCPSSFPLSLHKGQSSTDLKAPSLFLLTTPFILHRYFSRKISWLSTSIFALASYRTQMNISSKNEKSCNLSLLMGNQRRAFPVTG